MCGIMGYIGKRDAWPIVMSGLKRLEYRGYDSAGVATVANSSLKFAKRVGHLSALDRAFPEGISGNMGIGHTRWATHGGVYERNCHPHIDPTGRVAVVHNGIIDNADELRHRLEEDGAKFRSDTDSEVLAHLIADELEQGVSLLDAVRSALVKIEGTAGLLVVCKDFPDRVIAAKIGSPVVLGMGNGETFIASDPTALIGHTQRVVFLDDSEVAEITAEGFHTVDLQNRQRDKRIQKVELEEADLALGGYPHFMLKEISEQPQAMDRVSRGRLDVNAGTSRLGGLAELRNRVFDIRRLCLFGCGTSLHAGEVGRFLFERYARLPATAEDAAEFRTRNPIVSQDTLYVAITQSGETADTLTALREIKMRGGFVSGITNAVGSTVARETDCGVYIHAGPEIAVASTKAFTSQVAALSLMALRFARMHDLPADKGRDWVRAMESIPNKIHTLMTHDESIREMAKRFANVNYTMFVGRGISFPVAREGALKLKEIAYIPSDGLSGADMKHGSLALISEGTPVWAIVPPDDTRDRMLGNMQELAARGAAIMSIASGDDEEVARLSTAVIPLPEHHPAFSPILTVIPLQLYAYYVALELDRNVDRPRNLAKSVTVE